jgi:hypothetical protein
LSHFIIVHYYCVVVNLSAESLTGVFTASSNWVSVYSPPPFLILFLGYVCVCVARVCVCVGWDCSLGGLKYPQLLGSKLIDLIMFTAAPISFLLLPQDLRLWTGD